MVEEELDDIDNGGEGDELYEHHRFTADRGQNPLRLDKFLHNLMEKTSRNRIQNAAKAGSIHVNGKSEKSNYKIKPGDVVTIVMAHPPREIELIPEPIDLEILYEDRDVLVLNKQPGLVVHPGHGNYRGTLVNGLMHHISQLPKGSASDRPGLVHRLDKDTSGVMVIALNEVAMTHISLQFFQRTTDREYVALVWGDVAEEEGTVVGNIGRHPKERKCMAVFEDGSEGKHAVTHYRVLERFGYTTLVACKLETGRTHQIRVHMKHIGHPLFGDVRYGGDHVLKGTTFTKYRQFVQNCFDLLGPRQALHARSLGFNHPGNGKRMYFESPLPADFEEVLTKWRRYVGSANLMGE